MNRLALDGSSTPPTQYAQPAFQLKDYNAFPALQSSTGEQWPNSYQNNSFPQGGFSPQSAFKNMQGYISDGSSRPSSRHQTRESTPAAPALDDTEAFPSLGAAGKGGKKHHGKRGGHGHKEILPTSLAEVVKMSPSPGPSNLAKKLNRNGSSTSMRNGENSAAAQAIPAPLHVPWLETGERANKAYLKARQDAIKHGGLRNKFLQR